MRAQAFQLQCHLLGPAAEPAIGPRDAHCDALCLVLPQYISCSTVVIVH